MSNTEINHHNASSQLYKRVWPIVHPSIHSSVHPSVRPSIRRSVPPFVLNAFFWILENANFWPLRWIILSWRWWRVSRGEWWCPGVMREGGGGDEWLVELSFSPPTWQKARKNVFWKTRRKQVVQKRERRKLWILDGIGVMSRRFFALSQGSAIKQGTFIWYPEQVLMYADSFWKISVFSSALVNISSRWEKNSN